MFEYLSSLPGAVNLGFIWAVMAIGLFISFKILDFADLTVDGSFATGGCVCVILVLNGCNVFVALLVAFIAGAICGLITGLFHTLLGIPPILSGILTQLMLWSINLKILGKANVACSAKENFLIVSQINLYPSLGILVGILVILIFILYIFFGTEFGSAIRCTGANEDMAKANGINTKWSKIFGLMLSNALVSLSGALLAQYQGFADINMGRGAIVIGIASIIIGLAIVSKIHRNFAVQLSGVVIGAIIYFFVYQSVVFLGLDTDLLKLLSAVVVAVFLAIPYLKKTYFSKRKNDKGESKYVRA